jgi:hypothetical protein
MRGEELAGQALLGMPEKWAKGRPDSEHSPSSYAGVESEDRKEYRAWLTTWWVCQMLVTGILLVALAGCRCLCVGAR